MKQSPLEYHDELLTGRQSGAAFDRVGLADPFFAEALFDLLSDVVFFVKDADGCYVVVNITLTQRCGLQDKSRLIGRSPIEVFPLELGASYAAQDRHVITTGEAIQSWMELHLYPNRAPGWCLTHKLPLFDREGRVIGLTGISRDLRMPDKEHPVYRRVATAVT
jgi:PAS domain-containing protein